MCVRILFLLLFIDLLVYTLFCCSVLFECVLVLCCMCASCVFAMCLFACFFLGLALSVLLNIIF